jgi:hypothetical protein
VVAEPAIKYAVTEKRGRLEEQPLAPRAPAQPEKKGWSIFGRKKATPDLRAEPMPEPRAAEPRPAPARATAQVMQPQPGPAPQPQPLTSGAPGPQDAPRGKADDLFPDHKRDEQFEIPAFLRRQSN